MLVCSNDTQFNENCKFTSAIDFDRNGFERANRTEATPQQIPKSFITLKNKSPEWKHQVYRKQNQNLDSSVYTSSIKSIINI